MGDIITRQFNAKQKPNAKSEKPRACAQKSEPGVARAFQISTLNPSEHEYYDRRIVRISGAITTMSSIAAITELQLLHDLDPQGEIELRIHSVGGNITAGLAIFDFIKSLSCPVRTTAEGESCSMGAVLLAAGTPGLRTSMPNARIMVHQAAGGVTGHTSEMGIAYEEIKFLENKLVEIMAGFAGLTFDDMKAKIQHDNYMSADQAKSLGLIDQILQPKQPIPKPLPPSTPATLRLVA